MESEFLYSNAIQLDLKAERKWENINYLKLNSTFINNPRLKNKVKNKIRI